MKGFNLLKKLSKQKDYRFYLYYTNNSMDTGIKYLWNLSLSPYILGYAELTIKGRDLIKVIQKGISFLRKR